MLNIFSRLGKVIKINEFFMEMDNYYNVQKFFKKDDKIFIVARCL